MTITVNEAKAKALRVQVRIKGLGHDITKAQALEVVATCYGDATWAAMRARLSNVCAPAALKRTAAASPKLALFSCAMYGVQDDGERTFIAKRTLLCFTEQQARDFMETEFFNCLDYERPSFHVSRTAELSSETTPDLDDVCDWLDEEVSSNANALGRDTFWDWLVSRGATEPEDRSSTESEHYEEAIEQVAGNFIDFAEFLVELQKLMPEGRYYSSEFDETFQGLGKDIAWGAAPARK